MQRNEQHEEDQNGDEGPDLFIDNGELYFGIEAENTCDQEIESEGTSIWDTSSQCLEYDKERT